MQNLIFDKRKYGSELLIDAQSAEELYIPNNRLVTNFYVLAFLEKTSGLYLLDTQTILLEDFTILFIRPGQINNLEKSIFKQGVFLFFESDFLDEFFNDKNFIYHFGFFHNPQPPSFLKLPSDIFRKYYPAALEIREEINNLNTDSPHILRSLIYYLLVRLNQNYNKIHKISTSSITDVEVMRMLKYLETDIKNNLNVETLAHKLDISRVHLNNQCQKYFSKPVSQIIREYQIAAIKREIKYTNKSFSEISYEYSFSAPPHFTRFVKKMTGLTPHELKSSLSNW